MIAISHWRPGAISTFLLSVAAGVNRMLYHHLVTWAFLTASLAEAKSLRKKGGHASWKRSGSLAAFQRVTSLFVSRFNFGTVHCGHKMDMGQNTVFN